MEEFWKFIFGQGMFPEPKDDAAQIKRDAEKERAYMAEVERRLAESAERRKKETEAYNQRMKALDEFNAYLDRRAAENPPPTTRGWKVNRPGQNGTSNAEPYVQKPEPKDWLSQPARERDTFLPPSYYIDRDLPVPPSARELPENADVAKRYVAERSAQPQGGPN
jgi:hypothetical protein